MVKPDKHFRAWWTDVASLIIDCDPPSIASNDLTTFTSTKKTNKLYLLDVNVVFS